MIVLTREGGKSTTFQGRIFHILNSNASLIMSDQQSKAEIS